MNAKRMNIVARVTPYISEDCAAEDYFLDQDFLCLARDLEAAVKLRVQCNTDLLKNNGPNNSESDNIIRDSNFNERVLLGVCVCAQDLLKSSSFHRVMKLSMNATFLAWMLHELKGSAALRRSMLLTIYGQYHRRCKHRERFIEDPSCYLCHNIQWRIHVIIFVKLGQQEIIDKSWNLKIQVLVNEKCELEMAMAWLSTLGGAFSSLGDTYVDCAKKAGEISIQQLKIAMRLGDPLTICRCKIYIAMSLLQLGYYKETKHMIKALYDFSTKGEGKNDFRLKNMCIAVWNRLKYMLHLQNDKKTLL